MIDLIREHHAADPAMHVYHYAAYEITALKRLTCEYGTREEELDELLRAEVFVDLYKVVAQGLRLSHPRYGLKQVETFYFERAGRPARRGRLDRALRGAGSRATIRRPSTRSRTTTRRTASRRSSSATGSSRGGPRTRRRPSRRSRATRPSDAAETEELRAALLAGLPDDPLEVAEADRPRWLLAQLLLYHRREAKPVWWQFFDRIGRPSEELEERDSDAIGGLEQAGGPIGSGRSLEWPFTFPAQQHHLGEGKRRLRPGDRRVGRDDHVPRRRDGDAAPEARARSSTTCRCPPRSIPGGPLQHDRPAQQALRRLARSVLGGRPASPRSKSISCASRSRRRSPQDDLDAAKDDRRRARRRAPRDPGAARDGEDLHRRAADRAPDAARAAGGGDRAEPQGDPQPPRRGRARRRARRASTSAG